MQIERATKQEYDDNNYFDADYIQSVFGIECDLGSYHQEDIIPAMVEEANKLVPSNSLKFITGSGKDGILSKLEELKLNEEFQHNSEIVDMLKKCVELDITFDEFQELICDVKVY